MHEVWRYSGLFFLVNLCEAPIYCYFLRGTGFSALRRLAIVIALNVATHPVVFFLWPQWMRALGATYWQMVMAAEAYAVGIEIFLIESLIPEFPIRKAVLAALTANTCSLLFGMLLR